MSEAQKMRSRTSHRIARVEWEWIEFAGNEGDHKADPQKFKKAGLEGAMTVTEGLLKRARSRWSLEQVMKVEWVKGGIGAEIQFREEDLPDKVEGSVDAWPL
jgi:protein-serine/threonine kinase